MNHPISGRWQNERGAALISVVLVLALTTIIGISATSISTIEQQIATNDKINKTMEYHTDAGLVATAKIINRAYETKALPGAGEIGMTVLGTDADIYAQLMNHVPYDAGINDFEYNLDQTNVTVDAHRWRTFPAVGGPSAEFITGSRGKSSGGTGATYAFRLVATGKGGGNSSARISVNYMKLDEANAGGI